MSVLKVKVSLQLSEPRLPDRETWYELISDFEQEITRPSRVVLVVTDEFDTLVDRYKAKSPLELGAEDEYTSMKPGGAMAGAKTIEQVGDRIAVIANVYMAALGKDIVRRILLHEAQHVRLIQGGDSAIAVHRRTGISQAPEGLDWNFTWIAESLIDEFRCERGLHEKGLPSFGMVSPPKDYFDVVRTLDDIRSEWANDQDIEAAHRKCIAVLDRISSLLAYAAAAIVSGDVNQSDWASVASMSQLIPIVSEVPSAAERMDDLNIMATTIRIVDLLRSEARSLAFDSRYIEDNGLWFEFLDRPATGR